MNDKRLPVKLYSYKWDNMKCKCHPTNSLVAQVDSLMKELDLQDKVLVEKLIRRALAKTECQEFEMALQCTCV